MIMDARRSRARQRAGIARVTTAINGRKARSLHMVVDALGMLLALKVTAANEQELAHVAGLAAVVQALQCGSDYQRRARPR